MRVWDHLVVEELIDQIRRAEKAGLYYLALIGALTLPDICGALASENGRATGAKYKDWLRSFVPEQAADADLIWGVRCSLLHQGHAHPKGSFPMAFTGPGTGQVHNLSIVDGQGNQVGWTSIEMFVEEVTAGAERWYAEFGETQRVKRNYEKFARIRPEGYGGVSGPVIA